MGGLAILIIVIAYLMLEPVILERDRIVKSIPNLRADLVWMQAHSDETRALLSNSGRSVNADTPALSLSDVQSTLREAGLLGLVDDLSGTPQGGISLNINDVAFSDLVQFLYMIKSRSQGRVASAEITRSSDRQGIVTANIVLREAGG
jgi:type II secretory pathway component PulM